VVATTRSSFGLAEVRHNLIAAAGGLFRLPRAIGRAAAMDAILTGEPIDAQRAFHLGLVSRLVEPGAALDEALRVARQIAAAAPLAVRASRRVVRSAAHVDDDTLRVISRELLDELLTSEDAREGLLAFAEKRAPQWEGR
jgi:enoyl-CoA hydratase